jgi:hypothetical protein
MAGSPVRACANASAQRVSEVRQVCRVLRVHRHRNLHVPRLPHAPVANRQQFGNSSRVGLDQQIDRVGPLRRWRPARLTLPRHLRAQTAPGAQPLLGRSPSLCAHLERSTPARIKGKGVGLNNSTRSPASANPSSASPRRLPSVGLRFAGAAQRPLSASASRRRNGDAVPKRPRNCAGKVAFRLPRPSIPIAAHPEID